MFAPLVEKPKPKDGAPRRAVAEAPRPGRSADPGWKLRQRAIGVQAQLRVAAVDDPLEREADRVAARVLRMPAARPRPGTIQPKLRAAGGGEPLRRQGRAPGPESFRGKGESLPAKVRGFFERWLGHDFGGVRLHRGGDAAASARSLGARAYTYGRDIVFGAGEYAPGSERSKGLLAHELTHVVQQGAGPPLVQRSPLSEDVAKAWAAEPTIEALLKRLSAEDVRKNQADPDLDAEIERLLRGRPDELWLARQIRTRDLGRTGGAPAGRAAGSTAIEIVFVRGTSGRRALVIAGVHGTEVQGIEVAKALMERLKTDQPFFTTIIVPSLFPDNAKHPRKREGATPTNRNFPDNFDLDAWVAAGRPQLTDASGKSTGEPPRKVLWENMVLMELMARYQPERIISIHGTWRPGEAGVFYDKRELRADEQAAAQAWARTMATVMIVMSKGLILNYFPTAQALEAWLLQARLKELSGQADATDKALSLAAAKQIDAGTAPIPGREGRDYIREKEEEPIAAVEAARKAEEKKENQAITEARAKGDTAKATALEEKQKKDREAHRDKVKKMWAALRTELKTELDFRKLHPSVAGNVGPKKVIDAQAALIEAEEKGRKAEEQKENQAIAEAKAKGDTAQVAALKEAQKNNRKSHRDKVAKMRAEAPVIENATWGAAVREGVSLGGYAPKRGMSVFTVEPPLNVSSDDITDPTKKKNRQAELKSYTEAVRTILLGAP